MADNFKLNAILPPYRSAIHRNVSIRPKYSNLGRPANPTDLFRHSVSPTEPRFAISLSYRRFSLSYRAFRLSYRGRGPKRAPRRHALRATVLPSLCIYHFRLRLVCIALMLQLHVSLSFMARGM